MSDPLLDTAPDGRPRRLTFGTVAAGYDRFRPSYPPQLAADVVGRLPGRRLLEIGAGTGKATELFAAYDVTVTCVEPDAEMADVLAAKFTGDDRIEVHVDSLESWSARDGRPAYDGLISAQAWHWTQPATRWVDAAAALRPGGLLALFWNDSAVRNAAVAAAVADVYERLGIAERLGRVDSTAAGTYDPADPAGRRAAALAAWPGDEMATAAAFSDVDVLMYEWTWPTTPADVVGYLDTTSAHLILPADVRADLTGDLVAAIRAHTGDTFDLPMHTTVYVATRT